MESAINLHYLSPILITGWGMVFFHLAAVVFVTRNKVFPHYAYAALLFVYGLMCLVGGTGAVQPITPSGFYIGTMGSMLLLAPISAAYALGFLGVKRGPLFYGGIALAMVAVFTAGTLSGLAGLSWHTVMSFSYFFLFLVFSLVFIILYRELAPLRALPHPLRFFFACYAGAALQILALAIFQFFVVRPVVHVLWVVTTLIVIVHTLFVSRNPEVYSEYRSRSDRVRESKTRLAGVDIGQKIALLEKLVSAQELFRDQELQVDDLARRIGLSGPQLSELVNRHLDKNFATFINGYRVAAARMRLEAAQEENILDIAYDCGFASKSSFNAVFLKMTGESPKDYRARYRTEKN